MTPSQVDRIEAGVTEIRNLLNDCVQAFPATESGQPDFLGHRDYHDEIIRAMRARRRFWETMLFELTKWGLIGFTGWFIVQVLIPAFIQALKGHP